MLQELMNMVRQFGHQTVVENPEVPNEHNEDVMREAGDSIFSGLQQSANNNDTESIAGLLKGEQSHPAVAKVQHNFADNIVQKFGINNGVAQGLSASLIPTVLRSLLKRPGTGGALSLSLLASLTGGNQNIQQNGLLGTLGAKLGLDKDGDGDVDLADLTRMVRR
jgi:hypothetical protein